MHFNKITAYAVLILSCSSNLSVRADDPGKFNKYERVSGFINITEIGGGLGMGSTVSDYSKYFAGITTMNGYVIDHHFLTGIGIGAYAFDAGILLPVYLDLRYTFNNRRLTPFAYGDGGLLVDISRPEAFGLFLNPGVGVIRKITKTVKISLSVGVHMQVRAERASFVNMKLGLYFLSNSGDVCKPSGRVSRGPARRSFSGGGLRR